MVYTNIYPVLRPHNHGWIEQREAGYPPAAMSLSPGTKLGPYEILGPLGAGGMGEVYRARDARLSREVAVKVLPASFVADPERLRRFEQEARATGQLNHANILAVYDTGTHEGTPYVVAELLEGTTLRDRLAGGPLPMRKAVDYARQIAQGLAAAHQKGIVHRDLKPENLFVTGDGRIKILDFGLAKIERSEGPAAALTQTPTRAETGAGMVLGTAGYMSPEQVRGQPADQRSDIFSFGCILYEMLSGRRAFAAPSSIETMNAILKEDPPEITRLNRDVPPGLERIVQHCLEKSPDERFQSTRDLAFDLESLSGTPAPAALRQAALPGARRSHARLVLALGLGLIALAAAYYSGLKTRTPAASAIYRQLTFRQGSIFSARFAPDGETVVYSASWDGHPAEVFTTSPGSPESRPLGLASAEILSVSRSGEMALLLDPRFTTGWMRSGTLARAPLSGGVPRQVQSAVQDADWSPDGQGLAVARRVAGRYRLEYPAGKMLYETETWLSSPRFSRDGRRIAFIDHPSIGDDRGRVAVVDLSGKVQVLTEPFSSTSGLAWSPSDDEIWVSASTTGNRHDLYGVDLHGRTRIVDRAPADISVADVSVGGKALVVRNDGRRGILGTRPGDETERDLSWLDWSRPANLSKDGRWVLFEEEGMGAGPNYSVYLRNTDGSPAVRLGEGSAAALSDDGQWAATVSLAENDRMVFVPRGAGDARTLRLPGFAIFNGGWFPDGRRLLLLAAEKGHLQRLYVMEGEEGTPKPITPEGAGISGAVSPDGASVTTSINGGPLQIFPVGGGEPRPVVGSVPGDVPATWSPDGSSLFVIARTPPGVRVDRLDSASGRRTPWKTLMPADKAGLVDTGFVFLSADASSYVYSYRRFVSTLFLVDGLR
jgi:eukaryotic-like serine/threonine-protein kinase